MGGWADGWVNVWMGLLSYDDKTDSRDGFLGVLPSEWLSWPGGSSGGPAAWEAKSQLKLKL